MRKRQAGFTMIELIVVIVILGILAATALPKFIDLRSDAQAAATAGIAGSLSSASSLNYAGCSAVNNLTTGTTNGVNNSLKCTTINSCDIVQVGALLQGGAAPANYTAAVKSPSVVSSSNGTSFTCELTWTDPNKSSNTAKADFSVIAAGNSGN